MLRSLGKGPKPALMMLLPGRSWLAILEKLKRLGISRKGPRKNWRQICEEHKPRIVLAQSHPAEKPNG